MTTALPFLSSYDPLATSEGALDPLGLYQIADQLAVQLVPAVRERMQRVRFLTAMAVGSQVNERPKGDTSEGDVSPNLVWEWLVVEALVRALGDDRQVWGVPGTQVARRALNQHGYLDARSYLKTPRIFGFHGVYKRLATHLGLVDIYLEPGPNAEGLADAWARGLGWKNLDEAKPTLKRWETAVRRSLREKPPRTRPGWATEAWADLARAFAPAAHGAREKRYLRDLLLATDERRLGALPDIWQLQAEFDDGGFREEELHVLLETREPRYRPLLQAIRSYEAFARSLQDAFDVLKAEAAIPDAQGYEVPKIANDPAFKRSAEDLHRRFESAYQALGEVSILSVAVQSLFADRFSAFAEPMEAGAFALVLCDHHKAIQRGKSADGKRPWFDPIGKDRIYIRHRYREKRRDIEPHRYVHDYRGWPIRRFYRDLA